MSRSEERGALITNSDMCFASRSLASRLIRKINPIIVSFCIRRLLQGNTILVFNGTLLLSCLPLFLQSACRARKGFVSYLPIHQSMPYGTNYCVDCIRSTTHSNLFSVPPAIIRMLKQGLNPRRAIVIHTYQLNLTFSDEITRA